MKTFSDETKQSIFSAYNGFCANCLNPIHSFHHRLPNTAANRKRFKLFLNSPMNCIPLCFHCHTHKAHKYRIKPELAEVYEEFLSNMQLPF